LPGQEEETAATGGVLGEVLGTADVAPYILILAVAIAQNPGLDCGSWM